LSRGFYVPLDTKSVTTESHPRESLGLVLKKLNQAQQRQTTQEQNGKKKQKADLNLKKT